MCLAIPMRVIEVTGFTARCEAKGVERAVGLFLMQHEEVRPGDLLMVHLGHAMEKMTEEAAAETWAAYDEILAAMDAADAR